MRITVDTNVLVSATFWNGRQIKSLKKLKITKIQNYLNCFIY